ncbi:hypothetical protein AB4383_16105 [Vibrio breoganii]
MKKIINFLYYHLLYHFIWLFCQLFPNLHVFNLIRGRLLGIFFKSTGKRLSIARGCTFNMMRNIVIADDVYIAHDSWINGTGGLEIGNNVIISPKVVIVTTKHVYRDGSVRLKESVNAKNVICDGVWIASNCTISLGVYIDKGCIIGANSYVNSDTIANCLYAGAPAKMIKSLK